MYYTDVIQKLDFGLCESSIFESRQYNTLIFRRALGVTENRIRKQILYRGVSL